MHDVPIKSGNSFIDGLFNLCVDILLYAADIFGVSYNTINIWVFCILWPIFTVGLIAIAIKQGFTIRTLKRGLDLKDL